MEAGGIKNGQKNITWRAHLNPCTCPQLAGYCRDWMVLKPAGADNTDLVFP